jgi:UDP-N-acetylmuramoyl-L-alanyl-D-glutamate--2,6-diaminopimelate ligase
MRLEALLQELPASAVCEASKLEGVEVAGVAYDSRQVKPGWLFVAMRGLWVDGHQYIGAAITQGAVAIVAETPRPEGVRVAWVRVADTEPLLGLVAAAFYGHPSRAMKVLAVTGTNGKTTVAWLVYQIIARAGGRPGLIGTVEQRFGEVVRSTLFTTPPALDLHALLAEMRDAGCTHVAMEASSHGLAQHRMAGVAVEVGGFTNLTRDHLDFHGTMEAYREAKQVLFTRFARKACFNLDDRVGEAFAKAFTGEKLTASVAGPAADLLPTGARYGLDGFDAELETPRGERRLRLPLVGRHNLENGLVALGMAVLAGIDLDAAIAALAEVKPAPGRLERVLGPPGSPAVLVDYAHSPDALEHVLGALKPLISRRLLCVFGAGGDRDPGKRPAMGQVVSSLADVCVVTSDNPRTEDPDAIIRSIRDGIGATRATVVVEPDRKQAIARAIDMATREDTVLIAGKGHETYQIIGTERLPFDDREVARAALAAKGAQGLQGEGS